MSKANVAGTAAKVALGLLALGAVKVISKINEFSFKDKVVLISGGSRGLGLIMARRFGREGAKLVLLARDEMELNRAIQELTDDGINAISKVCDITDEQQVKDAVAHAREHFGTIDVLINNAGIIQVGPMDSMTKEDYELALNTQFSISNALPMLSIDGDCAGKQIVEACRRGDAELIITMQAQALSKLNGIFPELTTNIMQGVCNFLPSNETDADDAGETNVPGWRSQSSVSPSVLTEPADSVSGKNNEI